MTFRFAVAALIALFFLHPAPADAKETPVSPKVWGYVARPDGSIGVYHLDTRTGDLRVVPRNTVSAVSSKTPARPLMLVAHPSGRYVYAFAPFEPYNDGMDINDEGTPRDIRKRLPVWQVRVYRVIAASGALKAVQTARVPVPLAGLIPHPSGRFLYGVGPDGILCVLTVSKDGALTAGKRVRIGDTFGVVSDLYNDGPWQITFAPNGKTLYTLSGSYSMEYRNYEWRQWRVGADGGLTKIGDTWEYRSIRDGNAPKSVREDPGMIRAVSPKGDTIVARGGSGTVWVCRTNPRTGGILPPGKPLPLSNLGGDGEHRFHANPRYPLVYVGKEYVPTTRYGVYRWGAAGELRKTGSFAPLLSSKQNTMLYAEPTGRYLIEWGRTTVATHRTNERGDVTPARAAKRLPNETGWAVLFVAPPTP
ncbi:MAG: hypothetical protein H7Y38_16500 [Armatimonadetes bacterium]|nr:hypothetical protein [Armatimonadota bacterium]